MCAEDNKHEDITCSLESSDGFALLKSNFGVSAAVHLNIAMKDKAPSWSLWLEPEESRDRQASARTSPLTTRFLSGCAASAATGEVALSARLWDLEISILRKKERKKEQATLN